jgi:YVTN family beta-propeller protein
MIGPKLYGALTEAPGAQSGIGVLSRSGGKITLVRMIPDKSEPFGMVFTHDGKLLVVANDTDVEFLDVSRAISGKGDPVVGVIVDHGIANRKSLYVNVTADDHFLFVSNEYARSITVIDLETARSSNFGANAIVGRIPTANLPIAVTISPDQRFLYNTSERALESYGWPKACKPENEDPLTAKIQNPEGAIIVVDVERAKTDPANSVLAIIPAGCSPVRLVLSPRGDRAYVTARNSNELLVFDTAKLLADPAHARIATVPVGTAPVGVALFEGGAKVIVANSNRFFGGPNNQQQLSVIDAAKTSDGARAVLGTILAGSFPRELNVTEDGGTLLVTNFNSDTLELVDLARLPLRSSGR